MISNPERRLIPILFRLTHSELSQKDALLSDIFSLDAAIGIEEIGRHIIQKMINDEERKRWSGKLTFKHRSYDHNYYNPPNDILKFGYRFFPPYELEILEAALRPREILMCFVNDPVGQGWSSACHINNLERLREFQRDYGENLHIYAVDVDKLNGEFDSPFTEDELLQIRAGG